MLHKDSITIDEFCNIHNEKIKRKITKRDLAKNLRQIVKMKDATLILKKRPEIELTLPCVVGEIDFGNLTFEYNIIDNLEEIDEAKKDCEDSGYDFDISDHFNINCISERWGENGIVAPHIEYGWPCFGGFRFNLISHFIIADYWGMANTFKDFIKSMNKLSHYYESAVITNCLTCQYCDDLIKPIVYRHTMSEDNKLKRHLCKACETIENERKERRERIKNQKENTQ